MVQDQWCNGYTRDFKGFTELSPSVRDREVSSMMVGHLGFISNHFGYDITYKKLSTVVLGVLRGIGWPQDAFWDTMAKNQTMQASNEAPLVGGPQFFTLVTPLRMICIEH